MSARFERVLDARCELGESPVWCTARRRLLFVDILGQRIHAFDPRDGALESLTVDEPVGCIAPTTVGGYIAGLRSGLWLLDETGARRQLLAANPEDTRFSRFNDGRVDPRGRYWVGTVDESKQHGQAALYRYDRRGLVRVAAGLMTSNGLAFAPDGRTLYHSDTPRFVVYRYTYDPDSGDATDRREFVRLDPQAADRARPDGAAVDSLGCYWTALYAGGRIQRYDPEGRLLAEFALPVAHPTMPAFGGEDLKTLFVTSARAGGGEGGALYALRVDHPGLPTQLFDPAA